LSRAPIGYRLSVGSPGLPPGLDALSPDARAGVGERSTGAARGGAGGGGGATWTGAGAAGATRAGGDDAGGCGAARIIGRSAGR
jgi:hypothetical protein